MHGIGQKVNRPFTIQTGRLGFLPSSAPRRFLPRVVRAKEAPPPRRGSKTTEVGAQGAIKNLSAKRYPLRARKPYGRWTGDKILAAGAPPPSAGGVPTSSFGATSQHRKGENRVLTREGEADTPAWQEMINHKKHRKRVEEIVEGKKRGRAAP